MMLHQYPQHPLIMLCPGCRQVSGPSDVRVLVTRYGVRTRRFVHKGLCLQRARELMDVVVEVEGAEELAWQQTVQTQTA